MIWLKSNWRWCALNLCAALAVIYVMTQGSTGWTSMDSFDRGLESGKWAIRFLLASLAMTPLNTYFGWRSALGLRKSAGLWAFGSAGLHVLLYLREAKLEWLTLSMPLYLLLGLAGMAILSALALTSNRWSMRRLGKNWKRLHRFVYLAGTAVVTHSLLATFMSKKIMVRDPQALHELGLYATVLAVLLIVRVPVVRALLTHLPVLVRQRRKHGLQVGMPDGSEGLWPRVHGLESGAPVKPALIIPAGRSDPSLQDIPIFLLEETGGNFRADAPDLSCEGSTDGRDQVPERVPL